MTESRNISLLISVFLVIVILSDFHYKLLIYDYFDSIKFTLPVKIITGLVLGVMVVKSLDRKTLIWTLLLVISSGVATLTLKSNIYVLCQYFFGLIVMLFFLNVRQKLMTNKLAKIIEALTIINFIAIVLGVIFKAEVLSTYWGDRFGYNGIFKSTAVATYFYIFSMLLYMFRKKQNLYNKTLLTITIISSFCIGSKTLYAFVILSVIILVLSNFQQKIRIKSMKKIAIIGISTLALVGTLSLTLLILINPTLKEVLNNEGLITALFSFRDVHLINAFKDIQEKYSVYNYLFGGLDHIKRLTEIALIDLFLTFGLIGSILYASILRPSFSITQKSNFNFIMGVVFTIIFLRGNFLYFPSVIFISMVIFALVLNQINVRTKKHLV